MSEAAIVRALRAGLARYDYPPVVWDSSCDREIRLSSMRDVERVIRTQLTSGDMEAVKQGLANIVFWGFRSQPVWPSRLEDFHRRISGPALARATKELPAVRGPGLREIADLHLPQFSQVSFLSKIRMFLDPTGHVVLDKRLVSLGEVDTANLFRSVVRYGSAIPCTALNERIYARWCLLCQQWGQKTKALAVDVERAIFQIAKTDQAQAANLVAEMERHCHLR
jgi:hypothetical protein